MTVLGGAVIGWPLAARRRDGPRCRLLALADEVIE